MRQVLAATLVLISLSTILSFVTTVILVKSVLDGVNLAVDFSSWVRDVTPAAASTVHDLAAHGRQLATASITKLDGPENKWAALATHVLEGLGEDTNGTALVESTFTKLRGLYPDSGWHCRNPPPIPHPQPQHNSNRKGLE